MLIIELDQKKTKIIKVKENKSLPIHYIQTILISLKEHLIIFFSVKKME